MASESFENMSDVLYEANWQGMPSNLQKYFVVMIGNGQRTLFYHGFGIAVLNLETFARVKLEFH